MDEDYKNEEWRQISEAINYEVSSEGRVRNKKTGRILRPNAKGQVNLRDAGYTIGRTVGMLQTRAFWS